MRMLLALVILLGVTGSRAAVVDVFPGPGTPLQDGIDAASPGDTLFVHAGTYNESIAITKSLRIHARDDDVVIAAGCVAAAAVTVAADDVLIRGHFREGALLRIEGGASSVVEIQNRDRVTIKDNVTLWGSCAGVQNGFDVVNSTNVRIRNVAAFAPSPYSDAAIRIASVPVGGRVSVSRTSAASAARGMHVEDCPFGSRVRVQTSSLGGTLVPDAVTDGIVLDNSDGVLVVRNYTLTVLGTGMRIDATSDDNRIIANEIGPTGGPNVVDDGTSNCWLRNDCSDATCPGPAGCP